MSGFVKNFNTGIYSYTVNVIIVNFFMMVVLIELYLFIPFSVTLTIFQSHSNIKMVLTENFIFIFY